VRPERGTFASAASFLEEDSNGWLVTFSDLVLQLFAFVLVAAALAPAGSTPSAARVPERAAVAAHPQRIAVPAREPDALSLARFDDVPPRTADAPTEPAVAPAAARVAAEAVLTNEPRAAVAAPPAVDTSLAGELESYVIAQGLEDVVRVAVNGGGVTLSISDTIGFGSGRAELLPDAAPVLAEVRGLVAARPDLVVEVAGHTDDRPVHGGAFHSNLELSLARAASVARELTAGDPNLTPRVFAAGYGAERPVASNADADGRARNRRVELRLVSAR
jgi:flagellar motor protein MotB